MGRKVFFFQKVLVLCHSSSSFANGLSGFDDNGNAEGLFPMTSLLSSGAGSAGVQESTPIGEEPLIDLEMQRILVVHLLDAGRVKTVYLRSRIGQQDGRMSGHDELGMAFGF